MTRVSLAMLLFCCLLFAIPAQAVKGKKYALVVAVAEYKHAGLQPLKFPENDAEALAEVLGGKQGGYEVRVLSITRGKRDAKDHPTAKNVETAIDALLKGKGRDDLVLIAFSGHGVQIEVQSPQGKAPPKSFSYFCPTDADLSVKPKYVTGDCESLVNVEGLLKRMESCGASAKLLLVDACRNSVKDAERRNFDLQKLTIPEGVGALFSCKAGEFSYELATLETPGRKGHGLFFYHVINAMKGGAANQKKEVRWSRLVEYAMDKVSEDAPTLVGSGAKQTPHSATNFVGSPPVVCNANIKDTPKNDTPKKDTPKIDNKIDKKDKGKTSAKTAEELYQRGRELFYGIKNTKIHQAEAMKQFIEAAEKGHPIACVMLYRGYGFGEGILANAKEAKRWEDKARELGIEKLANDGNVEAMAELGHMTRRSEWFKKAADKGNLEGLYRWAALVPKEREEAYRKAAEDGHAHAQYGYSYHAGRASRKEAIEWLRKSANQQYPFAMFAMGQKALIGSDTEKDEKLAFSLFRKAAEQYHFQAAERFATMVTERRGFDLKEEPALIKEALMRVTEFDANTPNKRWSVLLEKLKENQLKLQK